MAGASGVDIAGIQKPLPTEGPIPRGTLVWGSDFNAAQALLYRWWTWLDAPRTVDTGPFWDDLFEPGARVTIDELRAEGLPSIRVEVARLRERGERAHHLGYDDFRLSWLDTDLFELVTTFTVQELVPGAGPSSSTCRCKALIRKGPDGRLLFNEIVGDAKLVAGPVEFRSSFLINRARATIVQFQAHMDSLSGSTEGMQELMMPSLELHGLVASRKDASSSDIDLTDVNTLRKSISGTDHVIENTIRDFDGFSAWFATCPALLKFGLHKLERFEGTPLPDGRYEALAQFDWRGETVNGARIETHQPLTWILVETGERYMRIEKLLPFG